MGNYFNPPQKLNKVGRPLIGRNYNLLIAELAEDEVLVAVLHNFQWPLAPHLFSEEEFNRFIDALSSGRMIFLGMFAVKVNEPGFDYPPRQFAKEGEHQP